jgi:predicted transcriptional regulator of viral defense system
MAEHLNSISVAQQLRQQELFYFTPKLVADLLHLDRRRTYRLLARLKTAGLIAEVEKGKLLLLGLEPERVLANPLFIASHVATPAYVSYWSALHYYGFTEQVPVTTFVATTRKRPALDFHGLRFHFVAIKPAKFFGYRRELLGDLPVLIADEAKAIVDSLDQPRYAGGVGEVARALRRALDAVEVSILVEYANRMANRALGSRLGYLLAALGRPAEGLIRSTSTVLLDPARPSAGRRDPYWRVVVNLPAAEIAAEGVG